MSSRPFASSHFLAGLVLFSLIFGVGGSRFLLLIGQGIPLTSIFFSLLGLLLTSVILPFMGLYSMALCEGNYRDFFDRMGEKIGFVVLTLMIVLIGPCGAISHFITLSYHKACQMIEGLPLLYFIVPYCLCLYSVSENKSTVMRRLGVVALALLVLLSVLFLFGFAKTNSNIQSFATFQTSPFWFGVRSGSQIMSFLAALFFCRLLVNNLKNVSIVDQKLNRAVLMKKTVATALWSFVLLFVVYSGLACLSAKYAALMTGVSSGRLLDVITYHILGSFGSMVSNNLELFAFFIASAVLSIVCAECLHRDFFKGMISYPSALFLIVLSSALWSALCPIDTYYFLSMVLGFFYSALCVLSVVIMIQKFWNVKIRQPVLWALLLSSIVIQFISEK